MNEVSGYWWVVALRGLAAVAFGAAALLWPGLTLATMMLVFGGYVLVDGVSALCGAVFGGEFVQGRRGWLVLQGLAGIGAGVTTLMSPALTAVALLWLIAGWAVVVGVVHIVEGFAMRRQIEGEGWVILAGLLAVAFGVGMMVRPAGGALALAWLAGSGAFACGLVMLVDSGRLFRLHRSLARDRDGDRAAAVA